MQFFNFRIGTAEYATTPSLNSGEAYMLWNQLTSRYDCLEKTQIYISLAHDPDFKYMLGKGIEILQRQIKELEDILVEFKIPLPCRPPKENTLNSSQEVFNDRLMFRDIMTGCENFMGNLLEAVRIFYHNDPVRKMFIKFITVELQVYDDLCKYGKLKSWLHVPPMYHA